MKDNPLEKDIEAAVCKHARELGMLEYKFTSPARRHVPDRIFLYRGKTFFIEFKRLGEPPTKAQAIEHAKMRERGATVFVVDNVQDGKRIVEREAGEKQDEVRHTADCHLGNNHRDCPACRILNG